MLVIVIVNGHLRHFVMDTADRPSMGLGFIVDAHAHTLPLLCAAVPRLWQLLWPAWAYSPTQWCQWRHWRESRSVLLLISAL